MGYFYWLRVKNSDHLHTELSLDYLKNTKFYLESKASFIRISGIASFTLSKPVLVAWLQECCTFSDRSVVNLRSSPWPNTPRTELFPPQKKIMFYYQTFFLLQICSLLKDCSWQIPEKKNRGSPCSFKRKGVFISGRSLRFCTHSCSCARANDAEIVRRRDAQCNTTE